MSMNDAVGKWMGGKLLAVALAAFAVGFLVRGCLVSGPVATSAAGAAVSVGEIWTCSMHPQIRQPKPGRCPICAMDLIPAGGGGDEKRGATELAMSPAAQKLAGVRLAPVERKFVEATVRMVGKVRLDETRVAYIAPRVSGRIDRLYVNFVGVPVKKGDHLADLYSPELLSAQQELIQAAKAARDIGAREEPGGADSTRSNLESVREKLRLWQLTPAQIEEVERSGKPSDHLVFYSPIAGIVVERMDTFEGMYVETGMKLFTVADLSRVWVKLEAYESDLARLRYGQPADFEVEAYPGEIFTGTIAFIDPVLDPMTRTVKVRVIAENRDGRLKPEMFAHAVVRVRTTGDGKVVQPNLAGKWISPMHPEIVKDAPGTCDVCGMALVPAEELGYAGKEPAAAEAPLVIPASAPLVTGERAVVYVAVPGKEGVFEGRQILLGPKAGDWYLVRSGLKEGELVVVNGGFKIDSSLQIQGRVSMMQPESNAASGVQPSTDSPSPTSAVEAPAAFHKQIVALLGAYFHVSDSLADDRFDASKTAASAAVDALEAVDMSLLAGRAHDAWMVSVTKLHRALGDMKAGKDLAAVRSAFAPLSIELAAVLTVFGLETGTAAYELRCPMALDNKGATWLQKDKETRNPYFGPAMLKCGEVIRTIPQAAAARVGGHDHE